MPHAIRIHSNGGPEQLRWEPVELGAPGPGQALVAVKAAGFNFVDVYHRTGLYPLTLPTGLGTEGAGVVEAVGKGVKGLKVGDRVCWCTATPGSYCEQRLIDATKLIPLPKDIKFETAAAMMLKGMTVEYLLRRTIKVEKGDTILVHAAAGGVGLILCQWAKALGAIVIGTVSTDAKAAEAKKHGCKYPIVVPREDFEARVMEITKGKGVRVVYDSVGKDTFDKSVASLRPRGLVALFGQASGPVPPYSLSGLAKKCVYVTRPSLYVYCSTREELLASAKALFAVVKSGKVKIRINHTFAMKDAAEAHRAVESRATTGSVVLLP